MDIASIALGGLNQAQSLLDRAASAVELSQAKTEFAANIQVVKTVDDMEKRSINLLG